MTALRVGLIGTGGIARAHLRAYRQYPQQVRLKAVCDVQAEAVGRFAQEAGGEVQVYTDPEVMLKDAPIDAVDICTVHNTHAPLAIMAADAGKHILVEKPMACSWQECVEMVHAAERAGVQLMVAQCQRYMPGFRGVKRVLESGELGNLHALRFDAMQNMLAFLPPGHWLYDGERAGGGVVISVAVHKIDLLRYLIGEVKRVSAVCRTQHPAFINGAEDYAIATLEFETSEGAVLGEMFATYSGFRLPWSEQFMIFGEQGAIYMVPPLSGHDRTMVASIRRSPSVSGWETQFSGFEAIEPEMEGLAGPDNFINEILHFAECCASGKEPLTSGRDNLNTMRIVFGIYESAHTGQAVEW
jgi:predicted dehydrogenase